MNKKVQLIHQLIFFLSAFLIVFFAVNPTLMFHQQQLGFISDSYIWHQYLAYPGGLAEYLSVWLFQFTTNRFWGSIMMVILMVLMGFFLSKSIRRKDNEPMSGLKYLPLIVLSVLVVNYAYLIFLPFLFVLIGLFLWLFKKLVAENKSGVLSPIFLVLLSAAAFYVLGGFGFIIWGVTALLMLLIFPVVRKWIKIALLVCAAVLFPYLAAKYVFFITLHDAYWRLQPYLAEYNLHSLDYLLFSSIPFLLILNWIIPKRIAVQLNKKWLLSVQYLILTVAFVGLALSNVDNAKKFKLEIGQMAFNENWEGILKKVKEHPSDDQIVAFQTNRALYHTGKMPYDLFQYNQRWGIDGLFVSRVFNDEMLLPTTELYIDFGYINEAIHWANEAVSYRDKSPQVIEQIIKAHIIEHNYKSAQLYINILKKMPFFRKKAKVYQDMVSTNYVPDELKDKRELMPYRDFIARTFPTPGEILGLLQDRPQNKMVYEYLMSYFLLKNDVTAFVKYYALGKRFDFGELPRIYQEAIALYVYNERSSGKPAPNVKLSNEVMSDFNDYISIITNMKGKMDIAQPVLKDKYGATYWYYINYISPVTRKVEVTTSKK